MVLLQQHEPGYRCVYQLQRSADGELRGVWHDTRSRSGEVALWPVRTGSPEAHDAQDARPRHDGLRTTTTR